MNEYWKCVDNNGNKGLYTTNKIYIINKVSRKIYNDRNLWGDSKIEESASMWKITTKQEYNKQGGIINQYYYFY